MSKRKRFGVSQALSRGLSETIHVVENNAGIFRNVILPLSRIELDPENPRNLAVSLSDMQLGINKEDALYDRKIVELEKIKELASTIESSGIINPIVVYKHGEFYRVVAGERRCLASTLIGKNEIEARVFNERPKPFELKLIQWIENTAREDLTLAERIGNVREIVQEYKELYKVSELTATLLKNMIGLSLPQASYYLAVLNASQDVTCAIEEGKINSLDKAAIIAGVASKELRQEILQACIKGSSLKELRKMIANEKRLKHEKIQYGCQIKKDKPSAKVNMGFTLNTDVVKTIVESVLEKDSFKKYADIFSKVNWEYSDQAGRAFKKLIDILEHEMVRYK